MKRDFERMQTEFLREKDNIKQNVEENLKGGEKVLRLEYERKIAELEKKHREEVKDKQKQIIAAQGELEVCQEELSVLRKNLRESENRVSQLEDEKNDLNQHYSALLQVHNQMLQFDIQKNEKTLHNERNSFLLTESDISVAKIPNHHYLYSSSKKARDLSLGNNNANIKETPGKSREVFEVLNSYKNELDKLKTNNSRIAEQFREEIRRLNEELETQNREKEIMLKELERVHKKERNMENKNEIVNYIRRLEHNCRELELSNRDQICHNKVLEEKIWTLSQCHSDHSECDSKVKRVKAQQIHKQKFINEIDDKENIPPPMASKQIKRRKESKPRLSTTVSNINNDSYIENEFTRLKRVVKTKVLKQKAVRVNNNEEIEARRSQSVGKRKKNEHRYPSAIKQN
jgi:hypothetical protein